MKIISWNVNGIRACLQKNCLEQIKKENPDVFCIQETKAHPDQVDKLLESYEHHYWNSADKKGYSGTAIFSKIKPLSVKYDINIDEHDKEGRVITAEFAKFYLVNVYTPNSGRGLVRLEYRKTWDTAFLKYLNRLRKNKPVIVCGDLNVAHTPIDLKNDKANYDKTAGYTQIEIDGFENLLKSNYLDSFREFNKEPDNYTYWSYMFNARAKNVGWRIDYFLVDKKLRPSLRDAFILPDIIGSDHCPVGIKLN